MLRDRTSDKIHVNGRGFGSLALSMTGLVSTYRVLGISQPWLWSRPPYQEG